MRTSLILFLTRLHLFKHLRFSTFDFFVDVLKTVLESRFVQRVSISYEWFCFYPTSLLSLIMFLTRLGEGAQMVVTGDITQIDLPKSKLSGLKQASEVLNDIKGVDVFYFNEGDVVRHPLVMRIIKAYSALKE